MKHNVCHREYTEKARQYNKQWYQRTKEEFRDIRSKRRKEWGIKNPDKVRGIQQRIYHSKKVNVLFFYSKGTMKCSLCNEADFDVLLIDHINGGGSIERKTVGNGHNFYEYLINNGFPTGCRVLCHNCNRLEHFRRINKNKILKIKRDIIKHYSNGSNHCELCGCNIFDVLEIDHTNGDGDKERKALNLRGGGSTYYHLKRNNFPDGYRVLCGNCNWREHLKLQDLKIKERLENLV